MLFSSGLPNVLSLWALKWQIPPWTVQEEDPTRLDKGLRSDPLKAPVPLCPHTPPSPSGYSQAPDFLGGAALFFFFLAHRAGFQGVCFPLGHRHLVCRGLGPSSGSRHRAQLQRLRPRGYLPAGRADPWWRGRGEGVGVGRLGKRPETGKL